MEAERVNVVIRMSKRERRALTRAAELAGVSMQRWVMARLFGVAASPAFDVVTLDAKGRAA